MCITLGGSAFYKIELGSTHPYLWRSKMRVHSERPWHQRPLYQLATRATLLLILGACKPQTSVPESTEVSVTGSDYAFQLPDTLRPGQTTLRFVNAGKVDHEVGLALLRPGATLAQVLDLVKAGASPDSLLDGIAGILIARPGVTALGSLAIDLLPGRTYALFCNLQDAPDKPPHSALGMVASRTVLGTR
jgi:hypothetical protein